MIFTQAVSDYRLEMDADGRTLPLLVSNEGLLYFGSLDGSMLSLFMSIAGGAQAVFHLASSLPWLVENKASSTVNPTTKGGPCNCWNVVPLQ